MRFLHQVYERAMEYDTKNTEIILPSQRACVYLREEFKKAKKTMILPEIITMEKFAEQLSGLKEEDNLNLVLWSYKVFSKHIKGNKWFFTNSVCIISQTKTNMRIVQIIRGTNRNIINFVFAFSSQFI